MKDKMTNRHVELKFPKRNVEENGLKTILPANSAPYTSPKVVPIQ